MPQFIVTIERVTVHTTELSVSAKDKDEAETKATAAVETDASKPSSKSKIEWDLESEDFDTREINEE